MQEDWRKEMSDLICINGAMYFGAVESPCSGRDTGECCHYEQTYEEATKEMQDFIQSLLDKQKEEIIEMIEQYSGDACYAKDDIINKIKEM